MKIIGMKTLDDAAKKHAIAKKQLDVWRELVKEAVWKTPQELKAQFGSADILKDKQVIFNIKGNAFRLWVKVDYQNGYVFVKKFGTHAEYNDWNLG